MNENETMVTAIDEDGNLRPYIVDDAEAFYRQQEAREIADRLTTAAKHELYETMKAEDKKHKSKHTYLFKKAVSTERLHDTHEVKNIIISHCEQLSRYNLSLSLERLEMDRDILMERTIITATIEATVTYN